MNNPLRDPFNLRRNLLLPNNNRPPGGGGAANALTQFHLLRATASHVATQVTERVAETASEALERGKQAVEDLNQNLREQRERGREKKDDDYNLSTPARQNQEQDQEQERSGDGGVQEKDMSFTIPKNVPSFSNPQRAIEDRLWTSSGVTARSSRGGGGGGGGPGAGILGEGFDKVGDFLNPNRGTLPMYKDKPYAYPPSSRSRPFYRRKRHMAWFLIIVLGVAYWLGMFAEDGYQKMPSLKTANWLKGEEAMPKDNIDWLDRRERVVEAFELSWDAYARYAWGTLSAALKIPIPKG